MTKRKLPKIKPCPATKKKARGKRGGDVVRMRKRASSTEVFRHGQWQWSRYASNGEFLCGSWPETFKRRVDCRKSAERAMTKCPIVEEK